MPEIREIDEFKNDFVRLGNEPEIRAQRGETLPDITVPEIQETDDLSALFEESDESSINFDDTATPDDLLDGLFDETGEEPQVLDESTPADGAEADEGTEDILDGFGDLDGFDFDEEESFDTAVETESEIDDFSLPEGLTDGLEEDLEPVEDFPAADSDFTPETAAFEELSEPETEAFSEDFSIDDAAFDFPDDTEIPAEGEDALPEVPEPEELGGISDFDSLDISDEAMSTDDGFSDSSFDFEAEDGFTDTEASVESPDDFSFDDMDSAGGGDGFSDDMSDDFSLEDFSLGEIDEDDIEATEFSLGDLGQEFGVDEAEETDIGSLEDVATPFNDSGEDLVDVFDDEGYAIPDDEWVELKKTLGRMPRNLKIIIEELIGEKNLSGDNLEKLLGALIKGSSAKDVASIVSKITGKKVKIPIQYERKTAEEFEKEKSTFGYVFRKNFIPMFRTAALVAAGLGLIIFIGFRFIYKPVHADSLYKKGYEEIFAGNNVQANIYFERAFREWRKKDWFYDYAEGFSENKQYVLSEEKYEELLGWYPGDRKGILDYADLEFKTLGKYSEAEILLKGLLFDDQLDYDARLMLGDTYMEWAREIEPSLYEEARFNYAKLLEQYGGQDALLFRMMRYFIRTDNHTEAMNLYEAFKGNPRAKIEPDIYAELAGYLIDNEQMEDVREILMKSRSMQEDLPEIHYELARYFDILDIPAEEEKALLAAIWLFEDTTPLTRTRNGLLIDSYNRYGKILYEKELYLDAEENFSKAALNYEEALSNGQLKPDPKYGNIYSNLGDLAYYVSGDYDQALSFFLRAEANGYSPVDLKYKKGFVYYNSEDYRKALIEFYDTAEGFSVDRQLLYSTANTLFNRNDYYLAEGYYTHLQDILEKDYSAISYLLIDEIPEHRTLLENMMKVSNNLGVTKYRLYQRNRDPEKNAEAMVLLTDSTEYYDKLVRDPNSLIEPETVNLSYLNSKAVFYPVPDYRPQIYQDIPKDLSRPDF